MSKTCGNWFTIDKKMKPGKFGLFLLTGHFFSPSQRASPPPHTHPPGENKLSGGPPHESYGVMAAVWRCGGGDGGAAAVVGRIVPRK